MDPEFKNLFEKIKGKSYVVGGFLQGDSNLGHWISIVASKHTNTLYVTDPMTSKVSVYKQIQVGMKNIFENIVGWEIRNCRPMNIVTEQRDFTNCGVYVMEM